MENRYIRRNAEEIKVSHSRVTPVCIVVDTSFSMKRFRDPVTGKTRMERLNEGIQQFIREIKDNEILSDSVEIAIVTFNKVADTALPFSKIEQIGDIRIEAGETAGDTPKGVGLALDLLEKEKLRLESVGAKYYQPWIVIMSDGRATASYDKETKTKDTDGLKLRLAIAQERTRTLESQDKLTVIPVLISESNDGEYHNGIKEMRGFSSANRCKEIGGDTSKNSFKEFFRILSRSVSKRRTDLLFADGAKSSDHNPAKTEPARGVNYISNDMVEKMLRREPVVIPSVMRPNLLHEEEDAKEVRRQREEAEREARRREEAEREARRREEARRKEEAESEARRREEAEREARRREEARRKEEAEREARRREEAEREKDSSDVEYSPGSDASISTPSAPMSCEESAASISTVTKTNTADDSYIEALLAGLKDWDNLWDNL